MVSNMVSYDHSYTCIFYRDMGLSFRKFHLNTYIISGLIKINCSDVLLKISAEQFGTGQ